MSGGGLLKSWRRLATAPDPVFTWIKQVSLISCRSLTDRLQTTAGPSVAEAIQPTPVAEEAVAWDTVKRQAPAGSALFREVPHFTPCTRPSPSLDWSALESSVVGRRLTHLAEATDWQKLASIENEVIQMKNRSTDLNKELDELKEAFSGPTKPDEYVQTVRRIHRELSTLKGQLRKLLPGFQKHCLQLPNVLHPACPTGGSDVLLRSLPSERAKKLIRWSKVENDVHHTMLGTYLTGSLAELEQGHLTRARRCHQKADGVRRSGRVGGGRVQTVKLSDLVRGPAVEAVAWFPPESVLRLQPSRSDLRAVPRKDVDPSLLAGVQAAEDQPDNVWLVNPHTTSYLVLRLQPSRSDLRAVPRKDVDPSLLAGVQAAEGQPDNVWLVNPHTTSYLVGSASLPAFSDVVIAVATAPRPGQLCDPTPTQGCPHCRPPRGSPCFYGLQSVRPSVWRDIQLHSIHPSLDPAYLMLNDLKVVDSSALPFQLLTQGSEYRHKQLGDKEVLPASFMDNPWYPFQQRKLVSLLEIYANSSACEKGFHDVVDKLAEFWSTNYPSWPLKLVYDRASHLHLCESLRVSLLLDFSANATPIKLASVSMLGDWVSRRASVRLGDRTTASANGSSDDGAADYAFMVYAKVLDSTSLITAFHEMGYMSHVPEEFAHDFSV